MAANKPCPQVTAPGVLLVVSALGITALFALGPGGCGLRWVWSLTPSHRYRRHPMADGCCAVLAGDQTLCCHRGNHCQLAIKLCRGPNIPLHSGLSLSPSQLPYLVPLPLRRSTCIPMAQPSSLPHALYSGCTCSSTCQRHKAGQWRTLQRSCAGKWERATPTNTPGHKHFN